MNPHSWSPRRWWSLVAGLGVLVLGYLVYDFLHDDPPPADAHLAFEFTPGPEEENGMWMLDQLEGSLEAYNEEPYLEDLVKPEDDSDPDWEAVRQRLQDHAEALEAVEGILAAPYFHGPWPLRIESDLTGYQQAMKIANVLDAQAMLELHDQEPDEAWRTLVQILKLGERIDSSPHGMVGVLTAISCKMSALDTVQENVSVFAGNKAEVKRRTGQLKAFQVLPREIETMLKLEYSALAYALRYFRAEIKHKYGPLSLLIYKPQRTKALILAHFEEYLRNVSLPATRQRFPLMAELEVSVGRFAYGRPNNYLGYWVLEASLSVFQECLQMTTETNANLEMTRLGLALAGYANEHGGALPPTLEALAPDYIDAVPLDPLTGEPFHYDPAARKVWSVGPDLTDDGGLPLGDGQSRDDPHDLVVEIPAPEGPAN